MSEIHRDRELEHLESMLYSYKVENKSMDTENERLKQEIRRLLAEKDKLRAALDRLYWYAERLEGVVYGQGNEGEIEVMKEARAALGGDT
jgi:predicted RNase H-like nuclease (RuvC/YqgF family)